MYTMQKLIIQGKRKGRRKRGTAATRWIEIAENVLAMGIFM